MVYATKPSWSLWQKVLNEQWPEHPVRTERHEPIPVLARIVWELDGEELVEAEAVRWTRHEVWVEIRDARCQPLGAWLPARDVERRSS